MKNIFISDEIVRVCPEFTVAAISCDAVNSLYIENLWKEINEELTVLQQLRVDQANKLSTIQATRQVYKQLGKDPNRYRPSGEALRRRIVKGDGLYQISTLVDLINLVSLKTGYSIGGFDEDKIQGTDLTLGVGREGEEYRAISRGLLNIENLPVYRDEIGGIGTPTSDEERTGIDPETTKVLILINAYDGGTHLKEAVDYSVRLLQEYASATHIETVYYQP